MSDIARGMSLLEFLAVQQLAHSGTGRLNSVLFSIFTACGFIHKAINEPGLGDVLTTAGETNIQGELVHNLDKLAQHRLISHVRACGDVAALVTEESEGIIQASPDGTYVVCADPLDGSSNIEVGISVGTIFSIRPRRSCEQISLEEDFLRPGNEQVAAGFVLYGSNTRLVLCLGNGVHDFDFDPASGNFVLKRPRLTIPGNCTYYSVNEGNWNSWDGIYQVLVGKLTSRCSARYVGSLVADFYRNLLMGGVFLYPPDKNRLKGKLRLLYESAPLAMIVEQAGGAASTGYHRVLDITPTELHQRTPLIIGNRAEVEWLAREIRKSYYFDE